MPSRFEPLYALIAYLVAAFSSGLAAIFDASGSILAAGVIIGHRAMLFACITGAAGGALVNLIFSPPKDASPRALAIKFLGSGITSVIFSPLIIQWLFKEPQAEHVLFVSGAVSLCAVYIIRTIQRAVRKRGDKFVDGDDELK
jgi:hypothetical protein